jgi:ribosomal protein S18 acetylase RimI-like enzyme
VDGGFAWSLIEESLPHPFSKSYDGGNVDQWLLSYEDAGPISKFRFFGAIRDGEMFGLATCSVSEWNSALWLVDIRVRESSRRSGVGSALIESVVELCREEQLRGVLVETQNRNHPAVCFYRRHGFQISGFNDHLYSNEDIANQDVAVYFFLKV